MQSDQRFFPQNPVFPHSNQVCDSYMFNAHNESVLGGTILPTGLKHSGPLHGVEFQPSEVCPKNFIIFDQTQNRSQIMFHPAIATKFCYPGFNVHSCYTHDNVEQEENIEKENPSSLREDSDDINALLDSEDYEQGDEDEVSTARTQGNYGSDSSDSCSSYGSKPKKSKLPPSQKSSGGSSCNSEGKRQKMRKMVKVLRGIVPGGSNRMNTAAVLDEAVRKGRGGDAAVAGGGVVGKLAEGVAVGIWEEKESWTGRRRRSEKEKKELDAEILWTPEYAQASFPSKTQTLSSI
ncbi:hypothetical protein RHSIM_RhsimUnG0174800 [Rhododendron simsii]|uniref:Uncharacterized protein n=1 Tax=Rhododendron simsii TaxID=118357 RepID=A0A834L2B4_RHOSS|nr:hypothetical protein RHSIM_RhsimUnG0174800 [Rhododendron simsii]